MLPASHFLQQVIDCDLVLFQLPGEILHLREPLFQQGEGFLFFFPAFSGLMPSSVASMALACRERETACLKAGWGYASGLSCWRSPTLQVGVFLHHIGVKIVLPLRQVCPVADKLLCAQAVVLCQRNKGQMQVGRFLVHVYHRRHDIFPSTRPMRKSAALWKNACISFGDFPLKNSGWRLSAYRQTVCCLPRPASRLLDTVLK